MNHLDFGAEGERLAVEFLAKMGWKIVDRNVAIGRGELDIIAMDGDELVIVEVRTRKIGTLLPPEMSVGPKKIMSLIKTARKYVDRTSYEGNWRIDVVAVTESGDGQRSVELFGDVTAGMEGWFMG